MSLQIVGGRSPVRPPSHQQVEQAKAHQHIERLDAIAKVRQDQAIANVQLNEQLRDSVTAAQLANVILSSEADERGTAYRPDFTDLPSHVRHGLLSEMYVAIRGRKTVFKRLAEYHQRKAIADVLEELASHKLTAGEIKMLAEAISGRARAAFMGVLTDAVKVTPTEYAAATLNVLQELP